LEKGWSRKHTKNRVTRWRKMFGGIFRDLRCFTKRMFLEEFRFGFFEGFVRLSTWLIEEGGPLVLLRACFRGILRVWGWFLLGLLHNNGRWGVL
jgi:hypothetical protein